MTSIQHVAGEKRSVVSVVSVCESPLRYILKVRPYVEENGQEKPRWCIIWSGGKLNFCGIYILLCLRFTSASPLLKTSPVSTDSDNKDTSKTGLKVTTARSASRLDSSPFEELREKGDTKRQMIKLV